MCAIRCQLPILSRICIYCFFCCFTWIWFVLQQVKRQMSCVCVCVWLCVCLLPSVHTHSLDQIPLACSYLFTAVERYWCQERTSKQREGEREVRCLCVCVRCFFFWWFQTSLLISTPATNFWNSFIHLKKSHLSFQVSLFFVYLSHECCSHVASWEVMGFLGKK